MGWPRQWGEKKVESIGMNVFKIKQGQPGRGKEKKWWKERAWFGGPTWENCSAGSGGKVPGRIENSADIKSHGGIGGGGGINGPCFRKAG